MKAKLVLELIGLTSVAVLAGAGPADRRAAPAPAKAAPAARAVDRVNVPAERPRARLGAAPRSAFKVNDRTVKVNPKEAGVRAVRGMAPQNYDAAARGRAVKSFYAKQAPAAANVAATKVKATAVGPFRREFVTWSLGWAVRDRAWWAWNNYAYFEPAVWAEWMRDPEFASAVAGYKAAHRKQVAGLIPEQYAASPAEAIYSDEYIDAVYNPVFTTPSIVVDGTAGGQLENLVEGVARTYGRTTQPIGTVSDRAAGLQFVSIPAGFDPTYQVEVKRDGDLLIFGPRKTPLGDGLGTDAAQWEPVNDLVVGSGIDAVYRRHVVAGDKIRLHGVEWSIASEQIELLNVATPQAKTAINLVDAELTQMVRDDGAIFDAAPELKEYLRIAQGYEAGMLTPLGNVNDEQVALYYAALDKAARVCTAVTAGSADRSLVKSGTDLARQVKGLEDSLGGVDGLRNPAADDAEKDGVDPQVAAGGQPPFAGDPSVVTLLPVGSVWVPMANAKRAGETMTVISVTPKTVSLRLRNGNGALRRLECEVTAPGRLKEIAVVPIRVPRNAPIPTSVEVTGTFTASSLTLSGTQHFDGKPDNTVDHNMVPQPATDGQPQPASTDGGAPDATTPAGATPAAGDAPPTGPRTIDLLSMVDASRDAVSGEWNRSADGLESTGGRAQRFRLPYRPPEEYDFLIEFTVVGGRQAVAQDCVANGHPFDWVMGGWGNRVCGLGKIAGQAPNQNATTLQQRGYEVGKRQRSLVQVRRDGVTVTLGDSVVVRYQTDFHDVADFANYGVGQSALGLVSFDHTIFHKVELTEVTGHGTPLRP